MKFGPTRPTHVSPLLASNNQRAWDGDVSCNRSRDLTNPSHCRTGGEAGLGNEGHSSPARHSTTNRKEDNPCLVGGWAAQVARRKGDNNFCLETRIHRPCNGRPQMGVQPR